MQRSRVCPLCASSVGHIWPDGATDRN
jgi:hypothetical protein